MKPGDKRIWPWWSVTKTATACCALRLAERGIVDLDAAVPGYAFTLRQLLRHEAGLWCYGGLEAYHDAVAAGDAPWSEAELIERTRVTSPRAAPGTDWAYSNVGFLLAVRALERAADCDHGTLLAREVLTPAGLSQARLARGKETFSHLPGSAEYDFGWVYPDCLIGPPLEAAQMMAAILDGTLLSSDSLAQLSDRRDVAAAIPGRPWDAPGYGMGLMCGPVRGTLLAGHSGAGPFSTCAVYGARDKIVAAFSTARSEAVPERAVARILTAD